jgi:hypothetical protein
LTDEEIGALEAFFASVEGRLLGFTFLDPTSNLLAWTEDLGNAVWQRDPMLTATKIEDSWHLANGGAGMQVIAQSIAGPGDYRYCLSVYVRAAQAMDVTLRIASQRAVRHANGDWTRIVFSANGDSGAESVLFGLEVPAGGSLEVRGIQVEPQSGASVYKVATQGGVYEDARLSEDSLAVTTTGPNRHSCVVKITHANHL